VNFQSRTPDFSCSAMRTRMCQCGFGHVCFIDRSSVSCSARIALGERTSEIRQSIDATRMSPMRGNVILISNV